MMKNPLQGGYLSVMEARTRDELQSQFIHFGQQLGFQLVTGMVAIDHLLGETEFITVDNTPAGYREIYEDSSSAKCDPVMQHCKTKGVPIIWDQSTYVKAGEADKWEMQALFGYRCGIAWTLHLPEGRHFLVGFDRDQPLPNDPGEVTRMVASLQLFAVYAQEAAMRLLVPAALEPEAPALTPRELETLRWTMEGKTAWEMGRILGIAENTVVRHTYSAAKKLGCTNKLQAVVKALRLRLIS